MTDPFVAFMSRFLGRAAERIQTLEADNARMREALETYAKPSIYEPSPHGPAFDDRDLSHIARAALTKNGSKDR